jgi:hypothetical protein
MIRRQSATEPAVKTDENDRNWLKGALVDVMHAALCGASTTYGWP